MLWYRAAVPRTVIRQFGFGACSVSDGRALVQERISEQLVAGGDTVMGARSKAEVPLGDITIGKFPSVVRQLPISPTVDQARSGK